MYGRYLIIGLGLTSKGQCGLTERTNWGSWDQWRNPGLYMYHYWTIEVTRRLKPGSYSDIWELLLTLWLILSGFSQIVYNQINIYLESLDLFIDAKH